MNDVPRFLHFETQKRFPNARLKLPKSGIITTHERLTPYEDPSSPTSREDLLYNPEVNDDVTSTMRKEQDLEERLKAYAEEKFDTQIFLHDEKIKRNNQRTRRLAVEEQVEDTQRRVHDHELKHLERLVRQYVIDYIKVMIKMTMMMIIELGIKCLHVKNLISKHRWTPTLRYVYGYIIIVIISLMFFLGSFMR